MKEYFRVVIDVATEKQAAYYLFQRGEGSIIEVTKRGRVALYRVHKIHLEKAIIEKVDLIEARTIE